MSVVSTMLFDLPQREIASLIVDRIARSSRTSIVTGFATPGGLATIAAPIKANPQLLDGLIIGAATYPAFQALDALIAAGVQADRLHVHLGHTRMTGGRKNPFARYHPMLHSKVYYMEFHDSSACAFIGSHNVTSFALGGLNGEAAVMLEGPATSPEFDKIRTHIEWARDQAAPYSSGLKEAYAWWLRTFVDGLKVEVGLPHDWNTVRTILIFASAAKSDRPKIGEHIYFEIPDGIEQIESLKTESHLFIFDTLPADPWKALGLASSANAKFTCRTLGAENRQGNLEVKADWRIELTPTPVLTPVSSGKYRPTPPSGMQQVRAEVTSASVVPFEYLFERERTGWDPEFSRDEQLSSPKGVTDAASGDPQGSGNAWKLVRGLSPRLGMAEEADHAALKLAAPESGSFILVSLRRRPTASNQKSEREE